MVFLSYGTTATSRLKLSPANNADTETASSSNIPPTQQLFANPVRLKATIKEKKFIFPNYLHGRGDIAGYIGRSKIEPMASHERSAKLREAMETGGITNAFMHNEPGRISDLIDMPTLTGPLRKKNN
jgi:hypothetical protein